MINTQIKIEKIKNTSKVLLKIGRALNCARTNAARTRLYTAGLAISYNDAMEMGIKIGLINCQ